MSKKKEIFIPQYGSKSITNPKKYIQYILKSKQIKLPSIPDLCFIIHSKKLLKKVVDAHPSMMIDIGSRNPTQINFCFPENGTAFAVLGEQLGASMSVVVLEELIALGFNTFISTGATGHPTLGESPSIKVGDMILVKEALIFEGTSRHYDPYALISYADPDLSAQVASLLQSNGITYHEGRVATTDALYRETPDFIAKILNLNALAIDMETSALYTVSKFRGKKMCALLYVSDIVCIDSQWDVNMITGDIDKTEKTLFALISKMANMS